MLPVDDLDAPLPSGPSRIGPWQLLDSPTADQTVQARDGTGRAARLTALTEAPSDGLRRLQRMFHPAIPAVLALGSEPVPHLITSAPPGESLARRQRRTALGPDAALQCVAAVADALATCHRSGVHHGNLDPSNVIVDVAGGVHIVGFANGWRTSAAADVRALGVLGWRLFHTGEPGEAPTPTQGPDWWRELLLEALAPEPRHRPSAARFADRMASHGIVAPAATAAHLLARAHGVHLELPELNAAVHAWLEHGGWATVVGPSGSGRTRSLRQAAAMLHASGIPFLVVSASHRPWSPIESALQDSALPGLPEPLPEGPDPTERAERAAQFLIRRANGALTILVDDLDRLDEGSRLTLLAAHRGGARVLATGTAPPYWAPTTVALRPWEAERSTELLTLLLGSDDLATQLPPTTLTAHPGAILALALRAVGSGALAWRQRRFAVDPLALRALLAQGSDAAPQLPAPARAEDRSMGALVALLEPMPRSEALTLLESRSTARTSLQRLLEGGWVQGDDTLRCTSPAAASALSTSVDDLGARCRRRIEVLLGRRRVPWLQLGTLLRHADDPARVHEHGPRCVDEAAHADAEFGVKLSAELCDEQAPARLVAARIRALAHSGRREQARGIAEVWLTDHPGDPGGVPILTALARIEAVGSPGAVIATVKRARCLEPDDADRVQLDLIEARAWWATRDLQRAQELCTSLCATDPDPDDPALWLEARALLARVHAERGDPGAGLALLEVRQGLGRRTAERARLEATRGELLLQLGQATDAAEVFEGAAAADQGLATLERMRLLDRAARSWYASSDPQRAVARWERAMLGLESVGTAEDVITTACMLCRGLGDLGSLERARERGEDALRTARTRGLRTLQACAHGALADISLRCRTFDSAQAHLEAAEALAETEGLPGVICQSARQRAELGALRRDRDALAKAVQARSVAERTEEWVEASRCAAVQALVLARMGRDGSARRAADAALQWISAANPAETAMVRIWLAECWLALGRHHEARQHASGVQAAAEASGWQPLAAWAARILAWSEPSQTFEQQRLLHLAEIFTRMCRSTHRRDVLHELSVGAAEVLRAVRTWVVSVDDEADADTPRGVLDLARCDTPGSLRHEDRVWTAAPVLVEDRHVGTLVVEHTSIEPDTPSSGHLPMLVALANHAAEALHRAMQDERRCEDLERTREAAHDLRSPLMGIALVAQQSLDSDSPLSPDDTQRIADGARHAMALLDAPQAHEGPTSAFDWAQAVQEWVQALEPLARQANVGLLVDASAAGWVLGRADELRRVVANLVTNAIRFTPSGSEVRVRTLADDDQIGVTVHDVGPGLPAETDRLFEAGVQGPEASTGQGLGLTIARRICRAHGGDVTAEDMQEGSCFTVRLPRAAPHVG